VGIESKPYIIVHNAGTNEVLAKDNKYRRLASYLGITRYNTMIERLNNSKVHTYSPTFDLDVTFLQIGMKYSDQALKGFTINETPITDVDLFSLPDEIIALQSDKCTKFNIYTSASHAAYSIDGKVEFKYIERYINVNKLVETNAGFFDFVKRPDYIAPTSQFLLCFVDKQANLLKGAKVQIVMHYPRYNTYVKFNSKADVSEFLRGHRKGAAALDRYLARFENKAPVLYNKTLTFYHLNDVPKGIIPLNTQEYYSLIENNRYIHK
jgi:hypothetical protein